MKPLQKQSGRTVATHRPACCGRFDDPGFQKGQGVEPDKAGNENNVVLETGKKAIFRGFCTLFIWWVKGIIELVSALALSLHCTVRSIVAMIRVLRCLSCGSSYLWPSNPIPPTPARAAGNPHQRDSGRGARENTTGACRCVWSGAV